MKTGFLIVIAMIVVLGGVALYSSTNKSESEVTQPKSVEVGEQTSLRENVEVESDKNSQSGSADKYVTLSPEIFNDSTKIRRVLFFYANWCPTCKVANEDFEANENQIPDDVILIRVNYNDNETDDREKELAKRHGITYQHTFVQVKADGSEVAKWNGGQIEELLSNLK